MTNPTNTPQEAMLEDKKYLLEIGPRHADAYLVIENGNFSIQAPGVNTPIPPDMISTLRELFETAERFGLNEH